MTCHFENYEEKPLYLFLKKKYYEQFERGEKRFEYRCGARWKAETHPIGRHVIISCGYSKKKRMQGVINSSFYLTGSSALEHAQTHNEAGIAPAEWDALFGRSPKEDILVIGIDLTQKGGEKA